MARIATTPEEDHTRREVWVLLFHPWLDDGEFRFTDRAEMAERFYSLQGRHGAGDMDEEFSVVFEIHLDGDDGWHYTRSKIFRPSAIF